MCGFIQPAFVIEMIESSHPYDIYIIN